MFDPIMEQILAIARDAWAFMAGLLIVVALLGGLYFILQGTAGMAFGGSRMTSMAIIGVVGLVIIVLFAFLFLPQIGRDVEKLPTPAAVLGVPCSTTAILASSALAHCWQFYVYSCLSPLQERW